MTQPAFPLKQGLYDPRYEHDSCGVGFVVDVKGRRSHRIVAQGIQVLLNLEHRGACGSEPNTGDGASILLQIPHGFFARECENRKFKLPRVGDYAVGMVFLPRDGASRRECEHLFERIVNEEGQRVLGWRTVRTDDSMIGPTAKASRPVIRQIFIGRAESSGTGVPPVNHAQDARATTELSDDLAFERRLYVIRKRVSKGAKRGIHERGMFYVSSLSSRTIVYKGMFTAGQLMAFYPELGDSSVESALALVHSRFSTNTFPSWARAHPYRYLAHNGEINTLRGNINWMYARESKFKSRVFGSDLHKILPVIDTDGSDSAMFDNALEMLMLAGRSLPHAMMMMVPEPFGGHESMTGRDVVIAALLGAEEFGFATAPLVSLGCIIMRVCHLNTCPVGVATQDPTLRARFAGDPSHVVNFMHFIAQEVRELMAELGFHRIEEMVGHTECIERRSAIGHWKAHGLDFSQILYRPDVAETVHRHCQIAQDHALEESLDHTTLLDLCKPALERKAPVSATLPIRNVNRAVGTILGSEVTRRYGPEGLPDNTIRLHFNGSAGQSFGAFVPRGITLFLEGDANDYLGKGLSGGRIVVYPPRSATFIAAENVIIGNVALYGATSGEAYICGVAGERFCVRNSGVSTVVEAVGDHGCEYMTGGRVVVLGPTGRNFAAGMSGGIAYVFDEHGDFSHRCNKEMVELTQVDDEEKIETLKDMVFRHAEYTGSVRATQVILAWDEWLPRFVRVIPNDYHRVLAAQRQMMSDGMTQEEAAMAAFELNSHDLARVGGR